MHQRIKNSYKKIWIIFFQNGEKKKGDFGRMKDVTVYIRTTIKTLPYALPSVVMEGIHYEIKDEKLKEQQ